MFQVADRSNAETAAQLEHVAQSYVARASRERRSHETREHSEGSGAIDRNLVEIIRNVKAAYTKSASINSHLWSFKVPVGVRSYILIFISHNHPPAE